MKFPHFALLATFGWAACFLPRSAQAQISEDSIQLSLDKLDLTGYSGTQPTSEGVLTGVSGVEYPLTDVAPFTALFSPRSFKVSEDGLSVLHKRTNETFPIPVYRSVFGNTLVQLFLDEDGSVSYAEIREDDSQYDTFFVGGDSLVPTNGTFGEDSIEEFLLTFTADDIDEEKLDNFSLTELIPPSSRDQLRRKLWTEDDDGFQKTVERSALNGCSTYRVVEIAIVYDAEFCGSRGSKNKARNRIIKIVASASALFERDMCVQLQLTDVYTPDSCGGTSNTFKNFNRDVFCGGTDYLLDDFSVWMTSKRDAAQIGSDSLVHLFTGFKPSGANAIGCAWKGTVSS